MKVIAYIDESGTHDRTGQQKGSSVAVMCGLVAWKEHWDHFSAKWQNALNNHRAEYFHFSDFATASAVVRGKITVPSGFDKNPYKGWDLTRLDNFLFEMAGLVGSGNKVAVGCFVPTSFFHDAKQKNHPDMPSHGDPYRHLAELFFKHLPGEIREGWPHCNEPVTIFYDQLQRSDRLRVAIVNAHSKYSNRKKYNLIKELVFADKKDPLHLPLQAADMAAFRFRQIAENVLENRMPDAVPQLDKLWMGHMFRQFQSYGPPKQIAEMLNGTFKM